MGRVKSGLGRADNSKLGKTVPTTKMCPCCGVLNNLSLEDRIYNCACEYSKDRDTHSANNMILFGSERANVEKESDLYKILSGIECKHLSMKQEAAML